MGLHLRTASLRQCLSTVATLPGGFLGTKRGRGRRRERPEGCERQPVVVKDCRLPEKTHLHAIEGCYAHVEEDAVEHGHGNELRGGEKRRKTE